MSDYLATIAMFKTKEGMYQVGRSVGRVCLKDGAQEIGPGLGEGERMDSKVNS
jgi:hypothetical protein